jgi:O-antigen/teichoic acid export membrane protein
VGRDPHRDRPAFHDAYAPIPLLALAMVFFGYRQIAQIGVIIKDRPGLVARSTAVAAATVLLLNWLLIPRFGAMGAAAATLGGFGTEFFIMRWFSMREYPLRIEVGALPGDRCRDVGAHARRPPGSTRRSR